mgnify:CR=1 FL=1
MYTRGAKDDYNAWAAATGDARWSWSGLALWRTKVCTAWLIVHPPLAHWSFVSQHEKWTGPPGGRSAAGQYNPLVHGYLGPIRTGLTWSAPDSFNARNIANVNSRPTEFRNKLDGNDGEPIGLCTSLFLGF